MIGNPNNHRREAVRAAQDRERGGMTPADWDAAEAVLAARPQQCSACDGGCGLIATAFCAAADTLARSRGLDAIGGP